MPYVNPSGNPGTPYYNQNAPTPIPQQGGMASGSRGGYVPGKTNENGTEGFSDPGVVGGPAYVPDANLWGNHLDFGENHLDTSGNGGHDPQGFWSTPQYGGMYGNSNRIAAGYGAQGEEYANRRIGNELSGAYRMQQGATRGLQQDAYAQQLLASQGGVPSAAQIGQGMALDANQQAAARAMALGAGAGGMRAAGAGALNVAYGGATGRAGEIATANQGLLGQGAGIRGGDQAAFGLDNAREMQQAEMNQKMQLGSQGMANQVLLDQLGADVSGYGQRLGYQTANSIEAANRQFQTQKDLINAGLQAGGGILSAYGSGRGNAGNGGGGY